MILNWVFRKYNISEEKKISNVFLHAYYFSMYLVRVGLLVSKVNENVKIMQNATWEWKQIWHSGPIVNLYILHVQIILPI